MMNNGESVSLIFDAKKGKFNDDNIAFVNFVGPLLEEAKKLMNDLYPILKSKAAKAKTVPWIVEKCPICACCCCCCMLGSLANQFGDELSVEINAMKVLDLHREKFQKSKIDLAFQRIQDHAEHDAIVKNILTFKVYVEPPPPAPHENPQNIRNPNEEMNQLNDPNNKF